MSDSDARRERGLMIAAYSEMKIRAEAAEAERDRLQKALSIAAGEIADIAEMCPNALYDIGTTECEAAGCDGSESQQAECWLEYFIRHAAQAAEREAGQ